LSNYLHRIEQIQDAMELEGLELYLVNDPIDLFYLTGMKLSRGQLFVHQEGATLIVDGRYFEHCQKKCDLEVLLEGEFDIFKRFHVAEVGVDGTKITHSSVSKLKVPVNDISLVSPLRMIKSAGEIALLRKSSELLRSGYESVLKHLKKGVTERELAWEFEKIVRSDGASGLSFDPIIAFGEHSAYPHHHPTHERWSGEGIVLIDIGVVVDDYCSDMTRTSLHGSVTDEVQKIHDVVVAAHDAAVSTCKIGIPLFEIDLAARKVIEAAGYGEQFSHSLGHVVGLEVHELPGIRSSVKDPEIVLKENMAFTIEPGIYVPGVGGVRHENLYLMQLNGMSLI